MVGRQRRSAAGGPSGGVMRSGLSATTAPEGSVMRSGLPATVDRILWIPDFPAHSQVTGALPRTAPVGESRRFELNHGGELLRRQEIFSSEPHFRTRLVIRRGRL